MHASNMGTSWFRGIEVEGSGYAVRYQDEKRMNSK